MKFLRTWDVTPFVRGRDGLPFCWKTDSFSRRTAKLFAALPSFFNSVGLEFDLKVSLVTFSSTKVLLTENLKKKTHHRFVDQNMIFTKSMKITQNIAKAASEPAKRRRATTLRPRWPWTRVYLHHCWAASMWWWCASVFDGKVSPIENLYKPREGGSSGRGAGV